MNRVLLAIVGLAVIGTLVLGLALVPSAERVTAVDFKVELDFIIVQNPGDEQDPQWTAQLVQDLLNKPGPMNDVNDIWAPAGISFNRPKKPAALRSIDDPQKDPGTLNGDVKVPPGKPSPTAGGWQIDPELPEETDDKPTLEADLVCDNVRANANPREFPVALIQHFRTNPVGGESAKSIVLGTARTTPFMKGTEFVGVGQCILLSIQARANPIVLAHELGHALCLEHRDAAGALMNGTKAAGNTGLNMDEIMQAQGCVKELQNRLPQRPENRPTKIPTPTPTPTPTPAPRAVGGISRDVDAGSLPAASRESGTGTAGLVAVIAGVTSGVIALGGAAWYLRRRRLT